MGPVRIRSDGVELELTGEAELRAMLEAGRLSPGAERWDGEQWRPLAAPRVVGGAHDPWAAWSEADDVAAETALERVSQAEEPVELPLAALTPMPRAVVSRVPQPLPDALVTPLEEVPPAPPARPAPTGRTDPPRAAPRPEPPRAGPRTDPPRTGPPGPAPGELIDFPRRPRPPAAVASALTRSEPADVPLVRPWRVAGMIAAMLLVLGGLWAVEEMTRPLAAPVVSVGKAAPAAADDPLAAVEGELRKTALGPVRSVRQPGDLEDALLLDLQKLGVQVVSIRAPVVRWSGRKKDDPSAVEVHVTFTPGADLNADLGAIALAVGRYKLHYKLSIDPFEVVAERPDGRVATTLDPARAERFAQSRITLAALLATE